jgi:hypothetical protein
MPLMQVVLEERKSNETPKIEFITAPWNHKHTKLKRLKKYVNAVVNLVDRHGPLVSTWAERASEVKTDQDETYPWVASRRFENPRSDLGKLKLQRKGSGADLPRPHRAAPADQGRALLLRPRLRPRLREPN